VAARVILDCDPGLDDAVALALALAHADVVGITTVGGNVGVGQTTANALSICDLLGRSDVPVHAGRDEPLLGGRGQRASNVHGHFGTGDVELPAPSRPAASTDAVGWIIETVRTAPGVWLIATGPLTNVAAALLAAPDLVDSLAGISWMGGSADGVGNTTATAEFNCFADPHAAATVLRSGHPNMSMAGLDVTRTVLVDRPWIEDVERAVAGRPVRLLLAMLDFAVRRSQATTSLAGAPVHDALAVIRVTHPTLLTGRHRRVRVVTDGEARGATVVETPAADEPDASNCLVFDRADASAIRALIAHTLTTPTPDL
jgi:inosine-uridine nucleoside N-ribohydrolase